MFSWVQLAILLLQIANKIINWAHDRGMISEGRRQVIAENAAAIQNKVAVRDKIRDEVNAMPEEQVDKELMDLVHPPNRKP